MSIFSSIGSSIIKGGAVKQAIRGATKGIKASGGKIVKGLKRGIPAVVRGVKSGSAQTRALPTALREAVNIGKSLPKGFGTSNTARVMLNKVSQNLAKASKGALNKDAAERLATKLAKNLADKKKAKVLKDILKNSRAAETWGQYIARNAKLGAGLARSIGREGAENIAIDKSISLVGKGLGGLGAGAGAVTAGVLIEKNKK